MAAPETLMPDATETTTVPGRWRGGTILPWLVTGLALVVATVTTVQWLDLQREADTRDAVQRAAEDFVVELTNWDASDGLDDTRGALRAAGTGAFEAEVDTLFGGTLGAELEEAAAMSLGEVEDVFVQRIEGDEAVALGVVLQELTTNLADEPERTVRTARITLVREDGRWLVSDVQLLGDDVAGDEEGAP